ncbi:MULTISPECIES: hypothetical protein [unclassified Nocardioides]|uniref:hypothetical protein n=1 Tax=unclassified Nocardioides TaxID=2615069 RepID=UPI00301583E4
MTRTRATRRITSAVAATALMGVGLVSTAGVASAADCSMAPDGQTTIWSITGITSGTAPTGLESNWVEGSGSINYSESATASTTATVSASVSAEAGVIFAQASATAGVSLAQQWGATKTWSYTLNTPGAAGVQYQMYQTQETRSFTASKLRYQLQSNGRCGYSPTGTSGTVSNAPVNSESTLVWKLRERPA